MFFYLLFLFLFIIIIYFWGGGGGFSYRKGYQSYKDNKKLFYADYYLLGQVNQCLNPPEDLKN